jgi:hypothetical protein
MGVHTEKIELTLQTKRNGVEITGAIAQLRHPSNVCVHGVQSSRGEVYPAYSEDQRGSPERPKVRSCVHIERM